MSTFQKEVSFFPNEISESLENRLEIINYNLKCIKSMDSDNLIRTFPTPMFMTSSVHEWVIKNSFRIHNKKTGVRKTLDGPPDGKCASCGSTETSQWRKGGLCNACGVRAMRAKK